MDRMEFIKKFNEMRDLVDELEKYVRLMHEEELRERSRCGDKFTGLTVKDDGCPCL